MMDIDIERLKTAALAATPGEWRACKFGNVVGGPLRLYVNGSAQQQLAMFSVTSHEQDEEGIPERQQANAEFVAAANPTAVLALIERLERAEAMLANAKAGDLTASVDAAMVEMANIHPPLRRSECERLIRAALCPSPMPNDPLDDVLPLAGKTGMSDEKMLKEMRELGRQRGYGQAWAARVQAARAERDALPDNEGGDHD